MFLITAQCSSNTPQSFQTAPKPYRFLPQAVHFFFLYPCLVQISLSINVTQHLHFSPQIQAIREQPFTKDCHSKSHEEQYWENKPEKDNMWEEIQAEHPILKNIQ